MAAPKISRQLDLTLISAKDLKNVNLLSKMDVYAFAFLSDDASTRQRTPTCTDCGRNPDWNFSMRLLIPNSVQGHKQTLRVQIRAERALGDRDVGEVVIPIDELESDRGVKYAAYQVRTTSGKAKGILNISYKLGDSASSSSYLPPPPPSKPVEQVTAYPPPPPPSKPVEPVTAYPPPPPPSKPVEPVTAYPPPSVPYGYNMPQQQVLAGYPAQPPPPAYGGYAAGPPPYAYQAYGGAGAGAGYGAAGAGASFPPPGGYGYNGYAPPPVQKPPKKNKLGLGLGAGLLGGALGGLLIGDAIGDMSSSAYEDGYDAGFDDGGGFDF